MWKHSLESMDSPYFWMSENPESTVLFVYLCIPQITRMKTSKERTILTVPALSSGIPRTSVKCLFIYVSDYENENQQGENYIDCSSIKDLSKVFIYLCFRLRE